MRILIAVAASLALLSLAARPARAQCCGGGFAYRVSCGSGCGAMWLYTCNEGDGNTYYAEVYVDCGSGGCGPVTDYANAGYCYYGAVSSLSPAARNAVGTSGETSIYVNAYARDCSGQYVAMRVAMARQAG